MKKINHLKEVLFGDSSLPYLCVTIYVAVFFVPYGMGIAEVEGYTALTQNLFAPLTGHYQSLYGSPLGPMIGHLLGIYSQTGYIIMSLVIVALCLWALTRSIVRIANVASGTRRALDTLVLLSLSPIVLVLFSWVGKTDTLIVLSYLAFVAARHPIVRNAAVVCLLLAHEEIAILLLCVHFVLNPGELRKLNESLPGIVLGVGALALYHHLLPPYQDRAAFVMDPRNLGYWLHNLSVVPAIAWAGFNWFWVVIGWAFWKRWLPRLALAAALAVPLAAGVITSDSTRVVLLVGFPLVWILLKKYLEHGKPLPYNVIVPALALSFIQSRYQAPEFRFAWSNWHTYPWEQMKVWKERYL